MPPDLLIVRLSTVLVVAAVLLTGLAVVGAWTADRQRRYLLLIALSTPVNSAGMLVQLVPTTPWRSMDAILGALLLVCGATIGLEGVTRSTGNTLGRWIPGIAIAMTVTAALWFGIASPDVLWRVRIEDAGIAFLVLAVVVRGKLLAGHRRGDRILAAALVVIAIDWSVRGWVAVQTNAVAKGAVTSTDLFGPTVYVVFAACLLAFTVTLTVQEVGNVISRLRRERDMDALTGLLNRGGFTSAARNALADSRLSPFTLVLCDIDYFKHVNDRYGHHAGDDVLRRFARALQQSARTIDRVGRVGGEEFAILLVGSTLAGGEDFVERVRARLSRGTFEQHPGITASYGIAEREGIDDLEQLMLAADRRLYHAKTSGRDRSSSTG